MLVFACVCGQVDSELQALDFIGRKIKSKRLYRGRLGSDVVRAPFPIFSLLWRSHVSPTRQPTWFARYAFVLQ